MDTLVHNHENLVEESFTPVRKSTLFGNEDKSSSDEEDNEYKEDGLSSDEEEEEDAEEERNLQNPRKKLSLK
jgi:hypothetical protein